MSFSLKKLLGLEERKALKPKPATTNIAQNISQFSDKFNPFDKDFVRKDNQTNIRNSIFHKYETPKISNTINQIRRTNLAPKPDSFISKNVMPTINKVPGTIQDFRPDRESKIFRPEAEAKDRIINPSILDNSKSGRDIKRGFNEFFASSPQWVGGLVKSQLEQDPTRVKVMGPIGPSVKNPFLSDAQHSKILSNSEIASKPIIDWISRQQDKNKNWIAESDLSKQESQNDLAKQFGGGGASLATAVGLSALTKSTAPAGILFGGMKKGQVYDEARAAGATPEKADLVSTAAGVTESALEKLGLDIFFNKFGTSSGVSNFVANSLIKSVSEGTQEGLQELGGNFWSKVGYDKGRDLITGVFESAFMGGVLGLTGGGSASSMQQQMYQSARKAGLSHEQASTFVDKIADKIANTVDKSEQYMRDHPIGMTIKDVSGKNGLKKSNVIKEMISNKKKKPIIGYHVVRGEGGVEAINKSGFNLNNYGQSSGQIPGQPKGVYFFTNKKGMSEDWADIATNKNTLKRELNLENPYKIKDMDSYFNEVIKPATRTKASNMIEYVRTTKDFNSTVESEKITKYLESQGYDGLIDEYGDIGAETEIGIDEPQIIVFDPKKISQPTRKIDVEQIEATPEEQKLIKQEISKATEAPTKERGLITSLKESDKVNQDLKEILSGEYSPKQNGVLYNQAQNRVRKDYREAIEFTKENTSDEAFAVGYVVIEKAMQAGDKKTAGEVAIRMAENATKAGQAIQALKMLDKMTPAGLVAYVERKVNRYNNEQNNKKFKVGEHKDLKMSSEQRKYFFDTAAEIQKMKDGVDKDVARFILLQEVGDVFPNTMREKTSNFWRAGLLTGTTTHLLNMVSTGYNLTAEQATRLVAVPFDMIASAITGKRSISGTTRGYGQGVKKGLGEAALYMKTGFDRERMASKYDYKKTTYNTKVGKMAGKGAEYVYRLLGAEDKLFWNAALQNSLYEQADVEAKNKGLRGEKKESYIQERVSKPSNAVLKKAQEQADVSAFHNKTRLGEVAKKFQKVAGMEYVIPFTNTPAAVAMQVAKYTPGTAVFTLANQIYNKIKGGEIDQRKLATSISRNVVGAVPFLIGAMLMGGDDDKEEQITTGYPITDKKKQAQWELEGKQEYSIRIGDKWYQMQAFGPAGLVMGIGAKYRDGRNNGLTAPQAMANSYISMIDLVKGQSFLEGIDRLTRAVQNIDDYEDVGGQALKYVQGQAASFIPAIVNETANVVDPKRRELKTFPEQLAARIPGVRNTLAEKKDVLGNTMERRTDPFNYIFNPARPTNVRNEDSAVVAELSRLLKIGQGASLTRESGKLTVGEDKFKLSGGELSELKSKLGGAITPQLAELVNSQGYAALNDEQKKGVIDDIIRDTKKPNILEFLNTSGKMSNESFMSNASKMNRSQRAMLGGVSGGATGLTKSTQDKINLLSFEKSNKNFLEKDGMVYRKKVDGTAESMTKDEYDYKLGTAKLSKYKRAGNLNGWMKEANAQLDRIERQYEDPNIDELDKVQLEEDWNQIYENMQKYDRYGGFKKSKSKKGKSNKESQLNMIKMLETKTSSNLASDKALRNLVKGISIKRRKI